MKDSIRFIFCLTAVLTTGVALAQEVDQPEVSSAPVAYVYVSRPTHLDGFAASSSGKLTPVPGSPFAGTSVAGLAAKSKYLFGGSNNGTAVDAFEIESNGAVHLAASTPVAAGGCAYASPLVLDRSGETLYVGLLTGGLCDDSQFDSFKVESSGKLALLGSSGQISFWNTPLAFSSNNKYAYGADCIDYEGGYLDTFAGLDRSSSGLLKFNSHFSASTPKPKSGDFFCASQVAADSDGHVAVSLQSINSEDESAVGEPQLAAFTIGSSGNLTTKSTAANMPTASTGVNALSMSPSGKLLAVGGNGFQIFHFNGSSPITKDSGVLQPGIEFVEFAWDGGNHLYALGGGKLFVYTVTTSSIKQASGSPYSIPEAAGLAVVAAK